MIFKIQSCVFLFLIFAGLLCAMPQKVKMDEAKLSIDLKHECVNTKSSQNALNNKKEKETREEEINLFHLKKSLCGPGKTFGVERVSHFTDLVDSVMSRYTIEFREFNQNNSVIKKRFAGEETELCGSKQTAIYLTSIKTNEGSWQDVINTENVSHNITVELCTNEKSQCHMDYHRPGYTPICQQKFTYRQILYRKHPSKTYAIKSSECPATVNVYIN